MKKDLSIPIFLKINNPSNTLHYFGAFWRLTQSENISDALSIEYLVSEHSKFI